MTEDDITRGLEMEAIEPSTHFQSRVMREIRRHSAVPPPIPFPWRRALWIVLALAAGLAAPLVRPELAADGRVDTKWLWCLGAVTVSAFAALAPMRLARR